MKRVMSLLFLLSFTTAIAGCNTVQGLGKDIQKAGEKMSSVLLHSFVAYIVGCDVLQPPGADTHRVDGTMNDVG